MAIGQTDLAKDLSELWRHLWSSSSLPMWGTFPPQEQMLQHARDLTRTEEGSDFRSLVASKIEDIRHFDVARMERAVAICQWGRSGTELLASYLDGHDDIIMLPTSRSQRIYQFFEYYRSLSLREKLITYPIFSTDFFQGDFPVAAADYYAAVNALFEVYGDRSPDFLESRRAFFLFLHIVYCVALGRRPVSSRPLIVYAQHRRHDQLGRCFVEDFPQGRFIHMVRDPITNWGRTFDEWFKGGASFGPGLFAAGHVIRHLIKSDTPHPGMESRTQTFRFEDLHLHLEETMRTVADWLGLPFRLSLLASTFNGIPWVFKKGTVSWSGPRPEQAMRDSRNVSFTDKGLLFAVFHEDFVAWNYPYPDIFNHALVRIVTCVLVLLIPTKIEIIAARTLFEPLRRGGFRYAINCLVRSLVCRVGIMLILAFDLFRRLVLRKKVLRVRANVTSGPQGGKQASFLSRDTAVAVLKTIKLYPTARSLYRSIHTGPPLRGKDMARFKGVLALLEPRSVVGFNKVRVGGNHDGGYVMIDDFAGISAALSLGVGCDMTWDISIAARGIQVLQFDSSIAAAPSQHILCKFSRKKVVSSSAKSSDISIPAILLQHDLEPPSDLLLKMDIEGSEWDIFAALDSSIISRFRQIVCEFHGLYRIGRTAWRDRAIRAVENLTRTHFVAHIHGNNTQGLVRVGDVTIPEVMEVTFVRRDRYLSAESVTAFPTDLDVPNDPSLPDINLSAFKFR